jgi:hypothetical protein
MGHGNKTPHILILALDGSLIIATALSAGKSQYGTG